MKITLMFAWYDMWVGVFIDRAQRRVFVFPLPMVGVRIEWGVREQRAIAELARQLGKPRE